MVKDKSTPSGKFILASGKAADFDKSSLEAAKGEKGLPKFSMLAYTGGMINVGFGDPVVIDLAGLDTNGDKAMPILLDHSSRQIVGHSDQRENTGTELKLSGVVSAATEHSETVVNSAKNGFPWQSSVGVEINRARWIDEDEVFNANGQEFEGPAYLVEEGFLYETSFVVFGADSNTESIVEAAKFKASLNLEKEGENVMTDEEKKALEAKKAAEKVEAEKKAEAEKARLEALSDQEKRDEASKQAIRAEAVRVQEVTRLAKDFPELQAKAISDGLSVDATKAAMFDLVEARKGSDIQASNINMGHDYASGSSVMEAAMCMQVGIKSTEKDFDEKTLDAASKLRSTPLRRFMEMCANAEGGHVEAGASVGTLVNAAYSTTSFPTILGNIANRSLREGFTMAPSVAVQCSEKLSTNNFQQYTGAKLGGLGLMEQVHGGEIKSGSMTEETFTYKTNTVGKIIGLTREDIENDDLGAFMRLGRNLGISAFKTRENDFWALVLANTGDFFGSSNANIMTTALSIAAVAEAETLLAEQTGIDGTPAAFTADILLVPSQLNATARAIYTGTKVIGATSLTPDANVFENVYTPLSTPYLANSTVNANASETAWYLMSKMSPAFGISYLRGNEMPIVEEMAMTGAFLGKSWRGYYDYGVCQIEHRAAVKSTGAGS